jgi:putative addiction module antidote
MTMKTKVRKIGNSYGILLPKEALQVMKVKEGDVVYLTEAPEQSVRVTPDRDGFSRKQEMAQDLMRRYRNALRELAK